MKPVTLARDRQLPLDRPHVMGVLNVTPDSFSDGGRFMEPATAVAHAVEMVEQGADIIDIGGESSRPGAEPVTLEDELSRIMPVLTALRKVSSVPVSVDTYKAEVARTVLNEGADVINDISALRFDPDMATVIAEHDVPVVIMHMLGAPRDMQKNPSYSDCVGAIKAFLQERVDHATDRGIDRSKIIIDPGIGFGKRLEDNLDILARLDEFRSLQLPIAVGASRKSFIGMIRPGPRQANQRLGGSLAAAVIAVANGAEIIRVHDVAETVEALEVLRAMQERV